MARQIGDKNYSPREKRLEAQNAVLKTKVDTAKKQIEVTKARNKELIAKIKELNAKK